MSVYAQCDHRALRAVQILAFMVCMKLSEAVAQDYRDGVKRARNSSEVWRVLRVFCKSAGDMILENLSEERIAGFLNSPHYTAATRRSSHSVINCFLRFWFFRGEVSALLVDQNRIEERLPPHHLSIPWLRLGNSYSRRRSANATPKW